MQADKKNAHSHGHDRAMINRLSKSIGHLESIKRMIENGRDCSEVVVQLAAVRGEISSTAKAILKEHLSHCILQALEDKNEKKIDEFKKAMDAFLKY
ncbi:transcriptional regulator, FrmR family [Campylobacter avium LMG 24591]|uniref:Transcriptional regulator, FrmR family n=1 Tax=Campylobacter avium LMG 24591 TaxID=522484 RepID=A0A222MWM0_9BACT|nr:metal-sensing transcriptional repressor [Campylobacter avium]ASQ30295.1 transcriptional regulator, FrmR family [Campylobacter avium LMG 24591]OYD79393.1 transcriptional regulator, FrmR family [Campylobacter avium]